MVATAVAARVAVDALDEHGMDAGGYAAVEANLHGFTLGILPLGHFEMFPRLDGANFRKMAYQLLIRLGFSNPDEAWNALRDQLPGQTAMVVDCPCETAPDIAVDQSQTTLNAALVLGKCCGGLFSPERPIIWSERRLARSVKLVLCDAPTFTRDDHE